MLAEQTYDDHVSIHDDATAQKLGFKGGTIEGPTHFSQFAPLGDRLWETPGGKPVAFRFTIAIPLSRGRNCRRS